MSLAHQCPVCGCRHASVTHTPQSVIRWQGQSKIRIKRRRVCRHCGHVTVTYELTAQELREAQNQSIKNTFPQNP